MSDQIGAAVNNVLDAPAAAVVDKAFKLYDGDEASHLQPSHLKEAEQREDLMLSHGGSMTAGGKVKKKLKSDEKG